MGYSTGDVCVGFAAPRLLGPVRLGSVKGRILVFALLATLIPALALGWQSYTLNRRFVTEKISKELESATSHTVRELSLWLRERAYEMRVFSGSYEVTENLEILLRASSSGETGPAEASRRLIGYLKSVRAKFPDYEELLVVGPSGDVVATSVPKTDLPDLPEDWLPRARADATIVGAPYWDESLGKGVIVVGVTIRAAKGRLLGLMAGKLNFASVRELLQGSAIGRTGHVYLVDREGAVIVDSRPGEPPFMKARLSPETARLLLETNERSLEYTNHRGERVRGSLKPVAELGWGAIAEIGKEEAYAQTARVRDLALVWGAGLVLAIGLAGYFLALTIVRPLDRLTAGAGRVAAGDLEVDVPVGGGGEVGYLTQVFNHMVARLRAGRQELGAANAALNERNQELERLSITDGLTGLYNRKHLMDALSVETARARRHKHFFATVMIDIDHFKRYNDTHGHLAGDRLLEGLAVLLRRETRSIDFAARYGGEEFLLILPEVGADGALTAADRIRTVIASQPIDTGRDVVTISAGVAAFPDHGSTPETLIASADAALYAAKRQGRNRVVLAEGGLHMGSAGRHPLRGADETVADPT